MLLCLEVVRFVWFSYNLSINITKRQHIHAHLSILRFVCFLYVSSSDFTFCNYMFTNCFHMYDSLKTSKGFPVDCVVRVLVLRKVLVLFATLVE